VVWSPLHGVVDFLECELMRRLCRTLLNFLFHLKIDGAIFCAMVGFIAMVHAIWRFHCVWASTAPAAMVRSSASLVVLGRGIFDGKPLGFFPVKALRSSSPSFLVAHTHQSQCCAQALGSCVCYHCNRVLELRLVLQLSSIARVYGNAGSLTY
jgi:hypothetical protein